MSAAMLGSLPNSVPQAQSTEDQATQKQQSTDGWFRHNYDQVVQRPTVSGNFHTLQAREPVIEVKRLEVRKGTGSINHAVRG
jgi:hypothetical protein